MLCLFCCFFQAEDGIRYLVRSRGLGDVYKRQTLSFLPPEIKRVFIFAGLMRGETVPVLSDAEYCVCLLYTSDAADERSSVDLGGRRIIKKKKQERHASTKMNYTDEKRSRNMTGQEQTRR